MGEAIFPSNATPRSLRQRNTRTDGRLRMFLASKYNTARGFKVSFQIVLYYCLDCFSSCGDLGSLADGQI